MRMRFGKKATPAILAAVAAFLASTAPAQAGQAGRVDVYTGELSSEQIGVLSDAGVDRGDVVVKRGLRTGQVRVEVTLTGVQAHKLAQQGVGLQLKKIDGQSVALRAAAEPERVFRPYSGAGNIREELLRVAAEHPRIAQAVDIGRSTQGQPITAVRL